MSIKTVIAAFNKFKDANPMEAFQDEEIENLSMSLLDEMQDNSDVAKEAILNRMDEKTLVTFMLAVQKATVAGAATIGDSSVLLCDLSGELQAYTHTVVLSVIGALIKEEIL